MYTENRNSTVYEIALNNPSTIHTATALMATRGGSRFGNSTRHQLAYFPRGP